MLGDIISILIAISIGVFLFFAFFTKNKIARNVSFVVLASIALAQLLTGFAGLISGVDFLQFLEDLLRGLAGLVVYVELGLIIFFAFFSGSRVKGMILKIAIIAYVVLKLLIEFNLF